jgi:hypothetical protein
MNTSANKPLYLPLLGAGSAVLLVIGIAIASLAISAQGFSGELAPAAPREAAAAAAASYRCAECGVIESSQKIEAQDEAFGFASQRRTAAGNPGEVNAKPGGSYAITIRLQDGSKRVITDAHPARWRPGERVTLIAGMDQQGR